jgi:hypothetical protein
LNRRETGAKDSRTHARKIVEGHTQSSGQGKRQGIHGDRTDGRVSQTIELDNTEGTEFRVAIVHIGSPGVQNTEENSATKNEGQSVTAARNGSQVSGSFCSTL